MKKNFNELLKQGHRNFYISIINKNDNPIFYRKLDGPSPETGIIKEFDFNTMIDRRLDIDPELTWCCGLESFGDFILPSYSVGLLMDV